MTIAERVVNSLLLPLVGSNIILPQPTVAEIVQDPQVTETEGTNHWIKGTVNWRTKQIPLISFEALCGQEVSERGNLHRVAVLYALEGLDTLKFYSLELQAIPRPIVVKPDTLDQIQQDPNGCLAVASKVFIAGQLAVIPNLVWVEQNITENMNQGVQRFENASGRDVSMIAAD
jgi:chemosensory pili system protein ChpC